MTTRLTIYARHRRMFGAAILGFCASVAPVQAVASPMQPYEIRLPEHVLRLSLPREMVREDSPVKVTEQFDAQNAGFIRDGFDGVFETLYDFNGAFWEDAYGSLKIDIIVLKKVPDIEGDITTIDGLDRYLQEWKRISPGHGPQRVFSRQSINGMPAVKRTQNTFAAPGNDNSYESQIYSLPLNSDLFVEVGFTVLRWNDNPRKERKWRPKAEAMREAIKATVTLTSTNAR